MTRPLRLALAIGLFVTAPTAADGPPEGGPYRAPGGAGAQETSEPPRRAVKTPALTTVLGHPRIDPAVVESVYNDAVIKDGGIDRVVETLSGLARDAARAKRFRANAWLVASHLQWRHGRMAPAIEAVNEGLLLDPYDELVYHKALLLDASGETSLAQEWYQKALAAATQPRMKETIRLRLTFLEAVDRNVSGLVELARTRDRDFRNRAAIALAILDYNTEALDLYQIFGDGSERYRQHLRLAQWAIKAGNAARAKDEAWKSVQAATLERDRRYGLALLVEAHTLDNSLDELLARLAQKKTLTEEEQSVRIDVLRQSGQYERAIELFKSEHRGQLTPEMRQRLLQMYSDAGQDDRMVAEYRQLIADEPGSTTWPEGLSQHYLERGDQASGRRVWEEFLARSTNVDTLLLGADSMTSFGLHDLALAATEKAIAQNRGIETEARVRLAQFDLYLNRGLNADAEATLAAIDKLLPAESDYRLELSDAYERIEKPQMAVKIWQGLATRKGGLTVDEKMRLAWLLDSTGRRDEALAMWRQLWASETQSARRRLVEDRLLMLAAELGALGDIAVELEEKLAKGTAEPKDISLLVSIYTKVGDSVSAIEVVTDASSRGTRTTEAEIASLKEQALVYLNLNEYRDFARVTRRLLEIDPANKVDHLQSLLLNEIESGAGGGREKKDESAQIRGWLGQLREVGGAAVGGEFEAGVMELAGFRDQAIDAYRRALAQHPERADNHLLLVDLLKQTGRQNEAVASLQYVTETAEGDELFLVAIDGITNMRTRNPTTLKWAERRALERLTDRDDKLYLYEMLAELAEEARDTKVYLSALENSLTHANNRRAHVLRELLSSTSDTAVYASGQGLHRPDPKRNLIYARRLISLGEELPPDVYTDLGKTFLKMNDPDSASRAFKLAVERTGRTSVVLDAARLFDQSGFDKEAITQYEAALIANSANVPAMYKLGRLRERIGAAATANDLYSRALLGVFSRQTSAVEKGLERTPPALDTLATFEYRRYYHYLLKGLLATLPAAPDARAARLKPLEDAFQQELQQVAAAAGPAGLNDLAYYPRLKVLSQCVRSAFLGAGLAEAAGRVDAALLQHFGRDTTLRAEIADERLRWGFGSPDVPAAAPATAPAATASMDGSLRRALDHGDYKTAVGISLLNKDQDSALAAYRLWVRSAGLPRPPVKIGMLQLPDRSPGIPEVAGHAWERLDQKHFASLAQAIHSLVTEQDAYAEKLLVTRVLGVIAETREAVPILKRVEDTLGQPLFAEDRLMRLINKTESWKDLNMPFILARLSPERQVEVLGRYALSSEVNWDRLFTSIGVVLSKPFDAAHAARLLPVLSTAFQVGLKRTDGTLALPYFMNYQFTASVHASNVPIVEQIEQEIASKYPHVFKVGFFKANLLRDLGRDREALAAFVDAALQMYAPDLEGLSQPAGGLTSYAYKAYVTTFSRFIFPKYKTEVYTLLEQKEAAAEGVTDALIGLRIELAANDPSSDYAQLLGMLQDMAARHPANEGLLKTLYPLYDQWGYTGKAAEILTELTRLQPDNRIYRYRLLSLWQKLDHPEKALAVAGDSTVDELSRAVPRNLYVEMVRSGPLVRFPTLKRSVDRIRAVKGGGDPQQGALALRNLLQALPPAGVSLTEYRMQMMDSGDAYLTPAELLALDWNEASASAADESVRGLNAHDRLLRALEGPSSSADEVRRTGKLIEEVTKFPFAVEEFDAHIRSLRAEDIDKQYLFYGLLIDAYATHGRADQELAWRTPIVQAGKAGKKELTLWLGLAARQPQPNALELLEGAERGGLLSSGLTEYQRVLLARLCAQAGRSAQAADLYNAVAAAVMADGGDDLGALSATYGADAFGRDNGLLLFTGLGLFEEARQHLDTPGIAQFVGNLLALSRPPAGAAFEQVHARFVSLLHVRAMEASLAIPALQDAAGGIRPTEQWNRPDILQSAYARARAGQIDEALKSVQAALQQDFDVPRDAMNIVLRTSAMATRGYQGMLGLTTDSPLGVLPPPVSSGSAIGAFTALFPARADGWPGAGAWVTRAARELPSWIEQQSVNRDAGVQLLALLTLRLHQMSDKPAAQAAVERLSAVLRSAVVSVKASTLAVSVADKVGLPIDLAVAQALVRQNRLHVSRIPGVIARTAQAEGADRALQLGEEAARFTSSEDVLAQLVAIAKQAGDSAKVGHWQSRQKEAASARTRLSQQEGAAQPVGQP